MKPLIKSLLSIALAISLKVCAFRRFFSLSNSLDLMPDFRALAVLNR